MDLTRAVVLPDKYIEVREGKGKEVGCKGVIIIVQNDWNSHWVMR